jgi:hypothetical protein
MLTIVMWMTVKAGRETEAEFQELYDAAGFELYAPPYVLEARQ